MKILHITFSLINGGKENMLVGIANEQQKLRHEVAIELYIAPEISISHFIAKKPIFGDLTEDILNSVKNSSNI